MQTRVLCGVRWGVAALMASCGAVQAQLVQLTVQPATLNRWMYPFDTLQGNRPEAPVFASILQPGFDDRDAEFILGFATSAGPGVATGLDTWRYDVRTVRVTLWIAQGGRFEYDPTADSVFSSLPSTDPQFVTDADVGKPVEIFGAGYRNGFGPLSFQQNSPFTVSAPIVPPAEGNRNVFAATYSVDGLNSTDLSRAVRQRLEVAPWGVGVTAAVPPGVLVPTDARFTIDLDLSRPEVVAYLQRALALGRLNLVVTGLHAATGGPGGGTSTAYPVFYTKENLLAQPSPSFPDLRPRIDLEVVIRPACYGDCDASGGLSPADFTCFLQRYRAGDPSANCDGSTGASVLSPADFTCFLSKYRGGC
jgi:hypothetical protein